MVPFVKWKYILLTSLGKVNSYLSHRIISNDIKVSPEDPKARNNKTGINFILIIVESLL